MADNNTALRFPSEDYVRFDPFEGDRDVDIRCRAVKLVRARKEHPCVLGEHTIKPGQTYRYETALVDGDRWGRFCVCVPCMDRWLADVHGEDEDDEDDEAEARAAGE